MQPLIALWNKLPPTVRKWLQGLEVAVITGAISAIVTIPAADFSSKAGVAKFIAAFTVTVGGCVRLYLTQSPVQNVVKELVASKEVTADGVTTSESVRAVVTGPAK